MTDPPTSRQRGGSRSPPATAARSACFSVIARLLERAPRPRASKSQQRPAGATALAGSGSRLFFSRSSRTGADPAAGGPSPGIIMTMSSSQRRILSVWLRRLATDRIERGSPSPAPAERPLALAAPIKSARRITALNDAAAKLGLRAGMALADARARYPALAIADAEPQADLALLATIADWCDRYTPLVGLDPPDGLLLDIGGCAHLFGGETELCRDLSQRLRAQGFCVRVAAAGSVGAAWAVARYGSPGVVPNGKTQAAIGTLPLGALRIDPDIVEALAQAGLKRVEDILNLPRAPLAARFGEILIRRLDQALGRDEESIVPRLPLPS